MRWPVFRDVLMADRTIGRYIRRTPLEYSDALSDAAGCEVWLKWENLQRSGSFKIRGAMNKMLSMSEEERARGVATCSSGNHALGVALAAGMLGIKAAIFVPVHCPLYKQRRIRRLGGEYVYLKLTGSIFEETEEEAQAYGERNDMVYVSSYHDPLVMAGAGTLALDVLMERPDMDTFVLPAGSGGLINGCATAVRTVAPKSRVWGVQSRASMPWVTSWESGAVQSFEYENTLADGLSGYIVQDMLDFAKTHIDGFVAVSEEEIVEALRFIFDAHHMVIEPSSAVVPAAILQRAISLRPGEKICAVISGGNSDTETYRNIVSLSSKLYLEKR